MGPVIMSVILILALCAQLILSVSTFLINICLLQLIVTFDNVLTNFE